MNILFIPLSQCDSSPRVTTAKAVLVVQRLSPLNVGKGESPEPTSVLVVLERAH